MNHIYLALEILLAYLMGSIPSAVWVGKLFYGIDVRLPYIDPIKQFTHPNCAGNRTHQISQQNLEGKVDMVHIITNYGLRITNFYWVSYFLRNSLFFRSVA